MTRPMPGPPDKSTHDRHKRRGIIHRSCPWCRPFCAPSKRLSDAEVAAEYWRARADSWAYELMHLSDWFGWPDDAEVVADPSPDDVSRWDDITHRFATHPHALEGDPA